jgi:hypothetical protein
MNKDECKLEIEENVQLFNYRYYTVFNFVASNHTKLAFYFDNITEELYFFTLLSSKGSIKLKINTKNSPDSKPKLEKLWKEFKSHPGITNNPKYRLRFLF